MKLMYCLKKLIFTLFLIVFLTSCGKEESEIVYEDFLKTENQKNSVSVYETVEEDSVPVENFISEERNTEEEYSTVENSKAESQSVLIHICGAVLEPGVYELKNEDRVCDAVEAAGGFVPDADISFENLAQKLTDGEQIYIPTKEEVELMKEDGIIASVFSSKKDTQQGKLESEKQKVNINTASVDELCSLPGIGESRAESIIDFRNEKGNFEHIEDIMKVAGIKEAAFEKIKDKISVNE